MQVIGAYFRTLHMREALNDDAGPDENHPTFPPAAELQRVRPKPQCQVRSIQSMAVLATTVAWPICQPGGRMSE